MQTDAEIWASDRGHTHCAKSISWASLVSIAHSDGHCGYNRLREGKQDNKLDLMKHRT